MTSDRSNGYDAIADEFASARFRSKIGVDVVRNWAVSLPRGSAVLDVGCGTGEPVTATLVEAGLSVSALDASPALVAAFRQRFPAVPVACEAAEDSQFFGWAFDGAVAIGLVFLLDESAQRELIARIAEVLNPEGRFLFTAPREVCVWDDVLTGRRSCSLGAEEYRRALSLSEMHVIAEHLDEGNNHYFEAQKRQGP